MSRFGEFLSHAGLFDGVWRCYGCDVELTGSETHDPMCADENWFLAQRAAARASGEATIGPASPKPSTPPPPSSSEPDLDPTTETTR